ncbi:MAG: DNA polymerase beta domain-containing protein [Candidatus Berkelbacteria bacterium Licking1014_7]|uniref:DNA polymerase beta domain-containing protein n=1 Tax=Candidatus Berkelbacteria bacterium Licking1014_7 TaxID=2017147 RepID=A0A554LIV4_9BACT|nr:MAG: DNA polymerase beta domain-containing protein [Candidatus Berkelbacteria bacterium Licking1014_7]
MEIAGSNPVAPASPNKMTKLDAIKIGKNYKTELEKNNIPVSAMYLFGSFARGKQREGSDIDFCVVSNNFGKNDFEEMVAINQIGKKVSPFIEAFPVSEKDFLDGSNPIGVEAKKTGKKF